MAIHITVTLEETAADLITGYSAGAKLYLDSATSQGGSYSNVTSTALVSGTEVYEFWDANGTSATFYKSRPGNSGATVYGAYSTAFQATAEESYASLFDLRQSLDMPDTSRDGYLLDLLRVASETIDAACGRRFYREPQVSGDGTYYLDVDRVKSSLLRASGGYTTTGIALDLLSITTLSVRASESSSYVVIAAGDTGYYLDAGDGVGIAGTDWPYHDVTLSPAGSIPDFYTGKRAVKIVGALGFPRIPAAVREACVDMAREAYRQGPGGGPAQMGTNQFGTPVYLTGYPQSFRKIIAQGSPYLRRSYVHV